MNTAASLNADTHGASAPVGLLNSLVKRHSHALCLMKHRRIMRATWAVTLSLLLPLASSVAEPVLPSLSARSTRWETLVMPGSNMEPTLRVDEVLLVDIKEHRTRPLRAGDIVAYNVEVDPKALPTPGKDLVFVMRVVAVAGDRVAVADGLVTRNGQPMNEPHANLSLLNAFTATSKEVLVPSEHVYVLGDNRGNSNDSRFTGPISLQAVRGTVKFAGRPHVNGPLRSVDSPRMQ
jgi:signal peptidase I